MLPYEDKLLHTVAVFVVPVALKCRILLLEAFLFVGGHCGIPLSGTRERHLLSCLFEDIALVLFALEVAQTLAAYDARRPFLRHYKVELVHIERPAALIDEGGDAVFQCLALLLVLQSVVAMAVVVMMAVTVLVVFIVMLIVVFVVMLMLFVAVMIVLMMVLHLVNPSCRCSHPLEIEVAGGEKGVERHVAIVALYDVGLGLNLAQYGLDACQFVGRHLRSLVEQNLRAELHLLYYETGEVVVAYFVACKVVATGKLVAQTQCIHHGYDAVEACRPLLARFG